MRTVNFNPKIKDDYPKEITEDESYRLLATGLIISSLRDLKLYTKERKVSFLEYLEAIDFLTNYSGYWLDVLGLNKKVVYRWLFESMPLRGWNSLRKKQEENKLHDEM